MKISYDSYSENLDHIVDRRRVGLLLSEVDSLFGSAEHSSTELNIFTPISNLANFSRIRENQKLIFDIVDGYLVEDVGLTKDYLRYLSRVGIKKFLKQPRKFADVLKSVCYSADLVTVGSLEQAQVMRAFNPNVFAIWDCHDEFGNPKEFRNSEKNQDFDIFWEGLSFTIFHFQEHWKDIRRFLEETNSKLHLVSNPNFKRYANKYFQGTTKKLVTKVFSGQSDRVILHDWSVKTVQEVSQFCDFGIIPIDSNDKFGRLKPENKLLLYWRLGLPTLFSKIPSYERLSTRFDLSEFAVEEGEWLPSLNRFKSSDFIKRKDFGEVTQMLIQEHNRFAIIEKWKKAIETVL